MTTFTLELDTLPTILWYAKKPNLKIIVNTAIGSMELKKGAFLKMMKQKFENTDTLETALQLDEQGNINLQA